MSTAPLVVTIPSGRYVIAVSGGVDSMVLLDIVRSLPGVELIVAHLDHGIRTNSAEDAQYVKHAAEHYGLTYEMERVELGVGASEAAARRARYDFLERCRVKWRATAILMAHHRDDVLETIIMNIVRGTGWRGLASLRSHQTLLRPLLNYDKSALINYARSHSIKWREDGTNTDQHYLRNRIRWSLIPRLTTEQRRRLIALYENQRQLVAMIDPTLGTLVADAPERLDRYFLIMAPPPVAHEYLQMSILISMGRRLLTHQARRAIIFAKVARPTTRLCFGDSLTMTATRRQLIVQVTKKC